MTKDQAVRIVGRQPREALRCMAIALTLCTWKNTAEDWQRLEAASVVLGRGTPARARKFLDAHKRAGKTVALPNPFGG